MQKFLVCFLILTSQLSIADIGTKVNFDKIFDSKYDDYRDIIHLEFTPQYEEDQPLDKIVRVEITHGSFDNEKDAKRHLEFIKAQIAAQTLESETKPTFNIITSERSSQDTYGAYNLIKETGVESPQITKEIIPADLDIGAVLNNREPNALAVGKWGWTIIRTTLNTFGGYLAITINHKDVHPAVAVGVSLVGGLFSGAMTYFNGQYGKFMTNDFMTRWIINSSSKFGTKMRKAFKLDAKSISKKLIKDKEKIVKRFPELANEKGLFDEKAWSKIAKEFDNSPSFRVQKLQKLMSTSEEFFKWWFTDLIFAGAFIELPKVAAGIGAAGSVAQFGKKVISAGTKGVMAQMLGDLAIQINKYQLVEELKSNVTNRKLKVLEKERLLKEIDLVLDKNSSYLIGDKSHKLLQRIENIARRNATFFSFLAVTGVCLDLAEVPFSDTYLIGVGAAGAFYYAHINNLFGYKRIGAKMKQFYTPLNEKITAKVPFMQRRFCGAGFNAFKFKD